MLHILIHVFQLNHFRLLILGASCSNMQMPLELWYISSLSSLLPSHHLSQQQFIAIPIDRLELRPRNLYIYNIMNVQLCLFLGIIVTAHGTL